MFGKRFKLQFFIISSVLFLLIFSANFIYFRVISKNYYIENNVIIKLIDNYFDESQFLLMNGKFLEFINFTNFFFEALKNRNILFDSIFLNFTFFQNLVNYSVITFSQKNIQINISTDIDSNILVLRPKIVYNGSLTFKYSKNMVVYLFNSKYEINCENDCVFLLSRVSYNKNEIIKTIFIKN